MRSLRVRPLECRECPAISSISKLIPTLSKMKKVQNLGSSQEARAQAVKSLREILASAIKSGADDSVIDAVVIADESGQELASVPVTEVLPDWLKGRTRERRAPG